MRAPPLVAVVALAACHRDALTERYQGMVELEQTDLSFEVPGRIVELAVAAGRDVHAGDTVARIDDAVDRATRAERQGDLAAARADLDLALAGTRIEELRAARAEAEAARTAEQVATRELEREEHLVAAGASTTSELDRMRDNLGRARGDLQSREQHLRELTKGSREQEIERARARVDAAEQAVVAADRVLDRHAIAAPIDASVIDVYPKLGEVVAAGVPVASIVDRTRPYADVFVPVPDLSRIQLGQEIALAVVGDPREVPGYIERIYPQLEFTPRYLYSPRERTNLMARIRVRLDDREHRLHGGQPAFVRLAPRAREAHR